ncbi:restriction endonuclease fold toxin [[Kitasatospora] papulosa]|uniref:restriction endonuclease fold toxin n=1 Tax=[Kitasatospora] papulosa TaxID=1464011 RepID=UPI0037F5CE56
MIATLLQAVAFTPAADATGKGRPAVTDREKPVKGTSSPAVRSADDGPRTPRRAPKTRWPKAGAAEVTLKDPGPQAGRRVKADGLPVELSTPPNRVKSATGGSVKTRVLGRDAAKAAGIDGLLVALEAKNVDSVGTVGATVDYSAFAEAFGGSYASRLTLVELPACVLESPGKQDCRTASRLETSNDTEARTLTSPAVSVRAGTPTVLAAVASDAGKTGDFKATPLSASSTWSTNLSSGDFNWSYDFPVPQVPGSMAPSVGLSYSSASIDGRTGNSNNQASWAGDGFDLWPGAIERRYKPCADDGQKAADGVNKPGDLCWGYDNAYITLNGKGGELVPVGKDEYRLQQDDGTRIARLKQTARGNGDDDNEYWLVTDPQGNRFYFGYNKLEGWAEGKETTDSTWTVPVYGDDDGEPCHAATFAASWCQQAYRWNLDYSIDTHGNAVAYYYDKEENSYGRNLKASDDTRYTRGGFLDRIEYGVQWDQVYSAKPLAKVDFTSTERCIPDSATDCDSIASDAAYWYDTPWDMNCDAATDCDKGRLSPTFWTRKRLTDITTRVLKGTSYSTVDSWKLTHRWGQADVDYQLLLASIQRTGHTAASAITLPKTTLDYTQLENRLDKIGDGYAPYVKSRLSDINDGHGGQTSVNYSAPVCDAAALPTPQTNTTRCFPQLLGGSDTEAVEKHWFNKYVVTSVTASDRTGGAPDSVTAYEYLDGAAWHYDDDDGLTKEKNKTWSQWRGYGHVREKTGGQGGALALKTQSDSYFLRGMDGDHKDASDAKKSVVVTLGAGEGDPITDHESAAGFAYRTETYSGPGGKVLDKTVNRPWHHETGKRVRSWGTVTSNLTGTANTQTFTSLDNGTGVSWRTTSKTSAYDTVAGRLTQVSDYGQTGVADNTCSRITYATNTTANILMLPSRAETVTGDCSATPARATDVLSDVRTAYDGGAYNAAPTKGDITATAKISGHDGTTARYLETGNTYDSYGRPLTSTDLTANVTATEGGTPVRTPRTDGLTSTTAYTPDTGFATTVTTKTPPAKKGDATTEQTTTSTLDPLRSQPTVEKDTNGKATTSTYDALGRVDKIWLADRKTTLTPSYDFDYFIEDGKSVAVRTLTLDNDGAQIPSYTLYDGLLRSRQTQTKGPDGGRLVADTFYDERGQVAKSFATYYTTGSPNRDLFKPVDALSVESQTWYTYDGLGREIESKQVAGNGDGGKTLGITRTIHGGDRTTVIPPVGGTATTTLMDVQGQATELRQHHTRSAEAAYDRTAYTYSPAGELTKVTDQAGNAWSYEYDQRGRQTKSTDPDKGEVKTTYDDRDQVLTTTDANKTVIHHTYDQLGREVEVRDTNATGSLRATWTYDTVAGAKGQLAATSRYDHGAEYTAKVTKYDQLYRPLISAVTIPDTEANKGLAGTYQTGTSYETSGLVKGVSYSAVGSLPGGSYAYSYDDTLRPVSLLGDGFRADTSLYSLTGKPLQYTYGSTAASSKKAWLSNTYEWGTQRLATSRVDREDVPGVDRLNTFSYDEVGNVTSVSDVSRAGTDNQCFTYDYLRRLTESWTEGDTSCQAAPSADVTGGVAPYWHSYTYDLTGNRKSETVHDLTGKGAGDVRRDYTYPAAGTVQPHAVQQITESGPAGTVTTGFDYDDTGNTTGRAVASENQTLEWDPEGHLTRVVQPVEGKPDEVTTYLYDTNGNRLIARGPNETTLYIGNAELVLPKGATTPKATRYIPLGGGSQAVQTDDGKVTITVADHLGTGQLAIAAADLSLSQRRTLPFGGNRGDATGTWPGSKGYIGGLDDTGTGLTHLGAREYDATIGRFISVDPLMDLADPQHLNGYAYSENNPATFADPTGLRADCISPLDCGYNKPGGAGKKKGKAKKPSNGKGSHSAGGPSGSSNAQQISENDQKELQATYNYFFNEDECVSVSIGYGGTSSNYCQTSAAKDAATAQTKQFLSALGDMTIAEPWYQCAFNGDQEKCDTLGYALSSLDMGGIAKGAAGIGKALSRTNKAFCSFTPETEVLMEGGGTKEIAKVEPGDKVVAADPETGQRKEAKPVVAKLIHRDEKLIDIVVRHESGTTSTLRTTTNHPVWDETLGTWVEAGNLTVGNVLVTSDGRYASVASLRSRTGMADMYNLTVSNLHTYYVLAGADPILVHNCGGMTASTKVRDLVAAGKLRDAADVHYEDMVRARTGGVSKEINGREIDVVTSDALIQVKRTWTAVNRPKNFLSKSTRNQIKATLSSAEEMGVRAEFWFKYGVHNDVRSYIENKGGIIRTGMGD